MIACCNIWGLDDYNRVWETYLRIITIGNPQNPILIIKAPTLGAVHGFRVSGLRSLAEIRGL